MSTMPKYGICSSVEQAFEVLKADELSKFPKIQEAVALFSKTLHDESKMKHDFDSKKKHLFVVVEGLDGCGKSTVTKKLSNKLKGVKLSTPGPQFQNLRSYFDSQPNHVRRAFYSLSNYVAALEIREELKTRPVILDRFWHSTATYALAGAVKDVAQLPEKGDPIYSWPKDLQPCPDVVFFLSITEDRRMDRLSSRSETTAEEDRLARDEEYRNVVLEAYRRMSNPKITEVNANLYPQKVVKEMLQVIDAMKEMSQVVTSMEKL